MFRIKICGITSVADALSSADAGAQALGLNFYEQSPRFLPWERAREIASAVQGRVQLVGVFVNSPSEFIEAAVTACALDWVQLHGDEPAEFAKNLRRSVRVLRAVRLDPAADAVTIESLLKTAGATTPAAEALLIDARVPGAYGGTGQSVAWDRLRLDHRRDGELPVVLAGGLTTANVVTAIRQSGAQAVDTASGVESEPGVKDPEKVRAFVSTARRAFDAGSRSSPDRNDGLA